MCLASLVQEFWIKLDVTLRLNSFEVEGVEGIVFVKPVLYYEGPGQICHYVHGNPKLRAKVSE